jgi:hypothetical protein
VESVSPWALAEAREKNAADAAEVAAAAQSSKEISDERKTNARTTALLRGDNEVLRERLAAGADTHPLFSSTWALSVG